MLQGIFPITLTPFDEHGQIDADSLRRLVRFELDGGVHGLGVGGFASEAYKLTDAERYRCVEIVAGELSGSVPLIIGMAPGSTEAAIEQARAYTRFRPVAFMVLPPNTMKLDEAAWIQHYVDLADAIEIPIMVQQSPHIMAYAGPNLSVAALAEIAERTANALYFKIEGPGSAERIAALRQRLGRRVRLFGGVGGLGLREEFQAGAAGLLPGCGFNDYFMDIWRAWTAEQIPDVDRILETAQPLVRAVSARGHEFSLHARKFLLQRAGIIRHAYVRRPTVAVEPSDLAALAALVDSLRIRIARPAH